MNPEYIQELENEVRSRHEDLRKAIRRRICPVLLPYKERWIRQPPFSLEELVVMALVDSEKALDMFDISWWVSESLAYYADASIGASCALLNGWNRETLTAHPEEIGQFFPELAAEFDAYEVPIVGLLMVGEEIGEIKDNFMSRPVRNDERDWTVSLPEASVFLRRSLFPPARLQFPCPKRPYLLQLSAELREVIFGMALHYPSSRLVPPHGKSACEVPQRIGTVHFLLSTKSPTQPFNSRHWEEKNNRRLFITRGIQDILALALVNKQCHREALPLFY